MILKKINRNGLSQMVLWLSKRWAQLELGPSCLALPEAKYSPRIYFWERFSSCITVGLLAAIFVLHQTESMHAKIWKDNFHAILETFKFRVAKRNLISKVKRTFPIIFAKSPNWTLPKWFNYGKFYILEFFIISKAAFLLISKTESCTVFVLDASGNY